MHAKTTFITFGLLTSTALSVPTAGRNEGFSVTARRSNVLTRRDASSSATKSVVVDFTFGGEPIPVALDSGSTFTYVASTLDTNKSETSSLPTLYNPQKSKTYHKENDPKDAYNCGGSPTDCFMGLDDISTAGLTAQQMAFGVTTRLGPGTFSSGQAATMGFGRQSGAPTTWLPRDQTFWYRVGAKLPLPYLFTVNLYENRNGTFDFGFIDRKKYTGDISYSKVDPTRTNWNFNMTGFAIGSGQIQKATEFTGVVDTGGPNIGLPKEIVDAYFNSFGGSPSPGNSHNYPCSKYPPPNLTLQMVGGGKLVLNGTFLVNPPDGSGSETCSGRLDDSQQTAYNLGASVLDQKFVVFDHANERVGFADKASPSGTDYPDISSQSSAAAGSATITTTATATATGGSSASQSSGEVTSQHSTSANLGAGINTAFGRDFGGFVSCLLVALAWYL